MNRGLDQKIILTIKYYSWIRRNNGADSLNNNWKRRKIREKSRCM